MNDDLLPDSKEEENSNQKRLFFIQLKKYWVLTFIIFILPILTSYYLACTNAVYKTTMLVHMGTFSWRELNYFFQNLSSALDLKDYESLSKTYFLKKDVAGKIESIQISRVKDQRESYIISLTALDISTIQPVELAITNYMDSNKYLQNTLAQRRALCNRSLDSIRFDLKNMNALRELAYTSKIQAEMVPYYIASINSTIALLRDKEKNTLLELSKINGFAVIESFGVPGHQKNTLLKKYMLLGLGMSTLLCFILLTEITPLLDKNK